MKHLFGELSLLLSRQLELAGQLLGLTKKQSESLSHNDAAGLFELAREQQELLDQIAANESRRKELQVKITGIFRISPDTGLKELIARAGDAGQLDLDPLLQQLGRRAKELASQNNLNRVMTLRAMAFNQTLLKVLRLDEEPTYHVNGKLHKNEAPFFLLNKKV